MKKLEFNDLVSVILNEDGFLRKIGKGLIKPSNWVGAAAAAVNAPKAITTAVMGRGQIGRGLNALQGGLAKGENRREEEQKKKDEELKKQHDKVENFDKTFVDTILMKSRPGTPAQQTTAGSMQASGTVTGGTATPAGSSGTSSGTVSAPMSRTPAAAPANPKLGEVFSIVGQQGRVQKYKILKIDKDVVSATPVI